MDQIYGVYVLEFDNVDVGLLGLLQLIFTLLYSIVHEILNSLIIWISVNVFRNPHKMSRSGRAETRSRTKDDVRRVMQAVDKVK